MVDGLAEVDARMRWSSNKRLHLELGVIQAVESVAEVSLSDVINAIDKAGGSAGEAAAAIQARRASFSPDTSRSVTVSAPPPSKPAVEAVSEPTPEPMQEPSAEMEEELPAALAEEPPAPETAAVETDSLWVALVTELQKSRPLIANWARMGTQLEVNASTLVVGFPESEASSRDSLQRPNTFTGLEGLLTDIAGKRMRLEFVLDASLTVPARAPEPTPAPEEKPAAPTPAAAVVEPAPPTTSPEEEAFYKDPLIDAVLDKLEARVVGRTFGNQARTR
jgi:DNA polymerase III subunit gamma/tau